MTPQQLIERVRKQPQVTLERPIRVFGANLRKLVSTGGMRLTDALSHPDQRKELRRFRYGHLLGTGATHASIQEWQDRHSSIRLNAEVVDLLTHVDGVHLWADLDKSRAYFGIRPLREWTEVAHSEWNWLFDEAPRGSVVISYHDNGDYFLVLDSLEHSFTWYDAEDFRETRTVKHSVSELLDWWWELTQQLDPRR